VKKLKEQSKKPRNSIGSDTFRGNIRLQLESADNYTQVNQFCEHLKTFRSLRIISYSWSEAKGLIIIVSLLESAALGDMLCQIPMVEQVYKKKKNIVVMLNATPTETASPLVTLSPEETMAS
jgi:hypothetical protein